MQLYNAMVRIGGSKLNEIPKVGLTAGEIIVLKQVHGGDDAVFDIKPTRMDRRAHADERKRLEDRYGAEVVGKIFGTAYNAKLPIKLRGLGTTGEDDAEADETLAADQEAE